MNTLVLNIAICLSESTLCSFLEMAGAAITVAEKLLKDTGVSMDGKCK